MLGVFVLPLAHMVDNVVPIGWVPFVGLVPIVLVALFFQVVFVYFGSVGV